LLERTKANLSSVDFSAAVEANWRNNGQVAPGRLSLAQASVYELPFADGSFDKVFCVGVLQHTPDFEEAVGALVRKAKPGGEIVVDFYAVRGFWTKLHAKYMFRPFTRRLSHERLLKLIDSNADWLIKLAKALHKVGLGPATRFLPLVDLRTLPQGLTREQLREWVLLDTFDMFSPAFDRPQRITPVARMFERQGADVTFAGRVHVDGSRAAVVRACRR
jgi:SAM-dependent methyltransferase